MNRALVLSVILGLVACDEASDDRTPDANGDRPDLALVDGGPGDAAPDAAPDQGVDPPDHRMRLSEAEHFETLQSAAREVKFLAAAPGGALPGPLAAQPLVFSNTTRYPLHLQFLRSLAGLDQYSAAEYDRATRSRDTRAYIPGSLFAFPQAPHPAGGTGVIAYAFAVRAEDAPADVARYAAYDAALGEAVTFPAHDLVLVTTDPDQEAWLAEREAALRQAGITFMRQAELRRPAVEIYSPAESYGYLTVIPPGEPIDDYGPRDIVLADAAHDDVSLISGLITTAPQSDGAHLNLRLREKRLPNLRWAGARDDARVTALAGRLIHLVARDEGGTPTITLEAARLEDAERFWADRQPPLGPPASDLTVRDLLDFGALSHASASAFGVKAANLGELFDALPAPNRASGFGIPFAFYVAHLQHSGIEADIAALLADDSLGDDRAALGDALKALRRRIRRAPLAPGQLDAITARVDAVFGEAGRTRFLRLRSSTNVEDLRAFSGAGLYDSKTGCLADDLDGDDAGPSRCFSAEDLDQIRAQIRTYEARLAADPSQTWLQDEIADLEDDLVDEKPLEDALRKVWRSLWNLRAFEERAYYGIPHQSAYMGVAVMPSFVFEQREAVALTNLPMDDGDGLYQVFTQIDDLGVVRPKKPDARPEELRFVAGEGGPVDFQIVRRSTESPDADLWTLAQRQQLAELLIRAQAHFETVYDDLDPLRLDLELELTRDDEIVIKQARPYLGAP